MEGTEREPARAHMLKTWPDFARYQARTAWRSKVFLLSPAQALV